MVISTLIFWWKYEIIFFGQSFESAYKSIKVTGKFINRITGFIKKYFKFRIGQ